MPFFVPICENLSTFEYANIFHNSMQFWNFCSKHVSAYDILVVVYTTSVFNKIISQLLLLLFFFWKRIFSQLITKKCMQLWPVWAVRHLLLPFIYTCKLPYIVLHLEGIKVYFSESSLRMLMSTPCLKNLYGKVSNVRVNYSLRALTSCWWCSLKYKPLSPSFFMNGNVTMHNL